MQRIRQKWRELKNPKIKPLIPGSSAIADVLAKQSLRTVPQTEPAKLIWMVEATTGIEPVCTDLQSAA